MNNNYNNWIKHLEGTPDGDALKAMTEPDMLDAFSGNIAFGTGGLRGIMGLGTNRLNHYTVERVTHGLAKTILTKDLPKSVCVAYDTRFNSTAFAQTVCKVLSAFGIKVHVFDKPVPTPMLSFAIRHLRLGWGVSITASHNPQEYNGYKVYNHQGVQVTDQLASEITKSIETVDFFEKLPNEPVIPIGHTCSVLDTESTRNPPQSLITTIDTELEELYKNDIISYITNHQPNPPSNFPFVYSALHGAGANAVPEVLRKLGYSPICIQQEPDGAFGGILTPNPEEPIVYEKAIEAAKKSNAKLLLATDPDCDRVGVLVKTHSKTNTTTDFETLNGNQIGALLIDYLVKTRGVNPGDTVITTIVSGLLGERIAKEYNLEFTRLLTGFKYIGEYAEQLTEDKKFFFGYEESYGFLAGDGARDKDAVIATALIVKMADYYYQENKTLLDRWEELSEEHGYCLENLHSAEASQSKQQEIMKKLRTNTKTGTDTITEATPSTGNNPLIEGLAKIEDYLHGLDGLPPADVIKLVFENKSWAAIRPSGTEPKIKLYTGVIEKTKEKAETSLTQLTKTLLQIMQL